MFVDILGERVGLVRRKQRQQSKLHIGNTHDQGT